MLRRVKPQVSTFFPPDFNQCGGKPSQTNAVTAGRTAIAYEV